MADLDSPHTVRYYDSFVDMGKLNIVMEYCDRYVVGLDTTKANSRTAHTHARVHLFTSIHLQHRGDLQRLLKSQGTKLLEEPRIWHLFIHMALGLRYLHSKRILHRDMKSANVFLCSVRVHMAHHLALVVVAAATGPRFVPLAVTDPPLTLQLPQGDVLKIGDLGVARVLGTQTAFAKTCVGTPYYLSPELCTDKPYNSVRLAATTPAVQHVTSHTHTHMHP